MHCLESLLDRPQGPILRASEPVELGWGLRICISIKFPGGADAGVPGTVLGGTLPQAILRCLDLSGGVKGKLLKGVIRRRIPDLYSKITVTTGSRMNLM